MLEYATLGQMASQVGLQIQDSSTEKATAIKDWINTHYAQVARGYRWKELLRVAEERSSTTAGQKYLFLTKEVEQVFLIFPQNNAGVLLGMPLDTLIEQYGSSYDESGLTVKFAEAGEVGYMTDFYTTGETLTITHSGSGTVSGVVHGLTGAAEGISSSVEVTEAVSILQTTGVVTSNTYTDLISVSVDSLAAGDVVTVTGTTSTRTYAKISAGERTARYKRIRLMPPSNSADTYTLVWKKRVMRLSEDHQSVEIPVGQVLIDMVVSTMLSNQREYGAAQMHHVRAQQELERLMVSAGADAPGVQQMIPAINLRRGYRYGGSSAY